MKQSLVFWTVWLSMWEGCIAKLRAGGDGEKGWFRSKWKTHLSKVIGSSNWIGVYLDRNPTFADFRIDNFQIRLVY